MKRVIELLAAPIHKVGIVLLRDVQSDDPLVCLTQVKAKNPAEQAQVKFGLPKGTRRYEDPETHQWRDARDFVTAARYRDRLEPLHSCLMNEASEEAGVDGKSFAQHAPRELGARFFTSETSGATFDIQWYGMELSESAVARMNPTPPDAHAVQWVRLSQMKAMSERGEINQSYYPVAAEMAEKMRARELRPTQFLADQPTR